jgi:hypothetical protein
MAYTWGKIVLAIGVADIEGKMVAFRIQEKYSEIYKPTEGKYTYKMCLNWMDNMYHESGYAVVYR